MPIFVKNVLNCECQKLCISRIIDLMYRIEYQEVLENIIEMRILKIYFRQIQTYLTGYFRY
jgi:hypothetical protein